MTDDGKGHESYSIADEYHELRAEKLNRYDYANSLTSSLTTFTGAIYTAALALYVVYVDFLKIPYESSIVGLEFFHAMFFTLPAFFCAAKYQPLLENSIRINMISEYIRAQGPKNQKTWEDLKKKKKIYYFYQRDFRNQNTVVETRRELYVGVSYFSLILASIMAICVVFNCLHEHDAVGLCLVHVDQCHWLMLYRLYYVLVILGLFACKFAFNHYDTGRTKELLNKWKAELDTSRTDEARFKEEELKSLILNRKSHRWQYIGLLYIIVTSIIFVLFQELNVDLDFKLQSYLFSALFILLLVLCLFFLPNFERREKLAEFQIYSNAVKIKDYFNEKEE